MRPPSRRREEDIRHTALVNNHAHAQQGQGQVQGRTLVELAQTRTVAAGIAVQDFGEDTQDEPTGKVPKSASWDGSHDRNNGRAAASVTIWDPERG